MKSETVKTVSALFVPELLALAQSEGRSEILTRALTSALFGAEQLTDTVIVDAGQAALDARRALGAGVDETAVGDVRVAIRALPDDPDQLRVARVLASYGTVSSIVIGIGSPAEPGCLLLISVREDGSVDIVLPEPGSVIAWSMLFARLKRPDLVMVERAARGRSDTFAWSKGVLAQRRSGGEWEEKGRGVTVDDYFERARGLLGETSSRA